MTNRSIFIFAIFSLMSLASFAAMEQVLTAQDVGEISKIVKSSSIEQDSSSDLDVNNLDAVLDDNISANDEAKAKVISDELIDLSKYINFEDIDKKAESNISKKKSI